MRLCSSSGRCLVPALRQRRDPVQHGISLTKGCDSPTQIGQPYSCTYSFRNITDEAQDTLDVQPGSRTSSMPQAGDVAPATSCASLQFVIGAVPARFLDAADLPGSAPRATAALEIRSAAPGLTSCTLPFGSRLNVLPFSFYTVQSADFNLPGTPAHRLRGADLARHLQRPAFPGTGNIELHPEPADRGAGSQTLDHAAPVHDDDRHPQRGARRRHVGRRSARPFTTS